MQIPSYHLLSARALYQGLYSVISASLNEDYYGLLFGIWEPKFEVQ